MSVFAWLMLIVTSVVAVPVSRHAQEVHSSRVVTSAASVRCLHHEMAADSLTAVDHLADCCGVHALPGCHCPAMSAGTLPTPLTMIAAISPSGGYDIPPLNMAPSPNAATPLRPPSI